MEHAPFSFPQWINPLVPDDSVFAQAYQDLSDAERARIKTGIARVHDCYGPRKDVAGEDLRRWTGGFCTRTRFEAAEFAVVLFDDSLLSPARLLAALVPAMAMGVGQVLAVRVGEDIPWRKAILTGLELAGQELVADMDPAQARRLLVELRDADRPGTVILLGPKAAEVGSGEQWAATRMAFWRPRFSRMATVWMEGESTFDLETLAFIHPDIAFSVYGAEPPLPAANFTHMDGGFDEFLRATSDVAYLPADRMADASGRVKLALGPGLEGCWIWPDLHPQLFQFHSTAWTLGD
ncbi:hypothetical protein [Pseudodesulfovibrio sp.]|uniref:hypothetical protein n=1 Tax=Pseudodesulfovibrio sp. TaxID=2035812 RepID=UPI002631C5B5|nr:hypothetical protein [Pseudodesulfovibrio sp.]MDD3310817.1 hypothetical protein [Pseudodesulfovibrio sp.]